MSEWIEKISDQVSGRKNYKLKIMGMIDKTLETVNIQITNDVEAVNVRIYEGENGLEVQKSSEGKLIVINNETKNKSEMYFSTKTLTLEILQANGRQYSYRSFPDKWDGVSFSDSLSAKNDEQL